MLAKNHAVPEAVSDRSTPVYVRETGYFIAPEQHLSRWDKVPRHFMSERFGSKIASTRFSSRSWASFLIQKRQDIEEMTQVANTAHQRSIPALWECANVCRCADTGGKGGLLETLPRII